VRVCARSCTGWSGNGIMAKPACIICTATNRKKTAIVTVKLPSVYRQKGSPIRADGGGDVHHNSGVRRWCCCVEQWAGDTAARKRRRRIHCGANEPRREALPTRKYNHSKRTLHVACSVERYSADLPEAAWTLCLPRRDYHDAIA
jgi:hypothetical protein